MRRVLIISNNVLSSKNNNGKTLLSFFKEHPKSHLAQLYFSSEELEGDYVSTSYRVSDKDVLRSVFSYNKKAGIQLEYIKEINESYNKGFSLVKEVGVKNSNLVRLLREAVWKISAINHQSLSRWLSEFSPDVIFFCAGDSLFAYDIYQTVCEVLPEAKRVVYITDDYVLPIKTFNFALLLRRRLVLSKMKKAVTDSNVFVTISDEMRSEYKKLFNKDSILAFNMSKNLKLEGFVKTERSDLVLVYAGGLHFKRWETLAALAKALSEFNRLNNRQVSLEIYSNQNISANILNCMEVQGVSKFCGGLDESGVQYALNNADILVHAESFEKECIDSTRLSISTKIAEYISVGTKILAIGPSSIASMRFLDGHVVCVNDLRELGAKLDYLLSNSREYNQDLQGLKSNMLKNKEYFNLYVLS